MRLVIAADHNGVALKQLLVSALERDGHHVDDRGTHDSGEVVDYPGLCEDVCRQVVDGAADRGIVVGGSGMGEVIACNKVRGIRAGLCVDEFHATISRRNNDANVLVLGAKVLSDSEAEHITATWMSTSFSGGVHQRRLEQLAALERDEPSP
ncbi:RpiB/LacA/LacB family sugar-phosphate isomerase [Aeromicrobium wangtongii]|uniref:RpiB/LacA/LacB family sugar-phosphate isomerase n=1 Tax=Aeromicrobium wangtongii TaxID=2969247 RepID=UPI002016D544|nr:RpiB/LacA/LacB family sugar-phosphate isomerase [Aeromicrobium wangtongii]MCL3817636.1 RpiB/LacA/LacB family sugar-phosphate isomerase [Aeromicrobium wangtongii]